MRWLLAIFFLALLIGQADARPLRGISGCPAGSPSPDGSEILPAQAPSCILADVLGNQFQFQTSVGQPYLYVNQGSGFTQLGQRDALEINSSGKSFNGAHCLGFNSYPVGVSGLFWAQNTTSGFDNVTWINPTTPLPNEFFIGATGYHDLGSALTAAISGQTVEIHATPAGMPLYRGGASMPSTNNLTLLYDSGSITGCYAVFGNAALVFGAQDSIVVNGGEWAYEQDTNTGLFRAINLSAASNSTVENGYYHDNDMGVLSAGAAGTTTIYNDVFLHNGSHGVNDASPGEKHNLYLSCNNGSGGADPTSCSRGASQEYSIQLLKSYCTSSGGYEMKLRGANATGGPIIQSIFTEADPTGVFTGSSCKDSATVDMPCGGAYTFGDGTAGHGDIFELGNQLEPSAGFTGFARLGEEAQGAAGLNCPYPGPGWATNSIVINKAIIINDNTSGSPGVCYIPNGSNNSGSWNFLPYVSSAIVENSVLVGNGTSNIGYGQCSDGGGNTLYISRAAAAAADPTHWPSTDAYGNPCCAAPYLPEPL